MATARTLVLLFVSILFLLTIFWFSTPLHHSSSLNHCHSLERVVAWLQGKRNTEAQYSNEDLRHQSAAPVEDHHSSDGFLLLYYDLLSNATSNLHYNENQAGDFDQDSGSVKNKNRPDTSQNHRGLHNSTEAASATYLKLEDEQNSTASAISPSIIPNSLQDDTTISSITGDVGEEGPDSESSSSKTFTNFEVPLGIELESNNEPATSQELVYVEVVNEDEAHISQAIPDKGTREMAVSNITGTLEISSNNDFGSSKVLPDRLITRNKEDIITGNKEGISLSPVDDEHSDQADEIITGTLVESSDQSSDGLENKYSDGKTVSNKPLEEMGDTVLSKRNFSNFVSENKYVAVQFYLPWDYGRDARASEYAEAAMMLEGKVLFAKVNAFVEKDLAREYEFVGYRALYFFVDGVHLYTYSHCCETRDVIVSLLKEKMDGSIQSVTRLSKAQEILMTHSIIVLAFLDTLEGPDSKEFAAAIELGKDIGSYRYADISKFVKDMIFYQTNSRYILSRFHLDSQVKSRALFIWRKGTRKFIQFDGPFTRLDVADFVFKNIFPVINTFNAHNGIAILKNPLNQVWLFAVEDEIEKVMPIFKKAAEAFNGKLLFVYIQMDHKDIARRLSYLSSGARRNESTIIGYSGTEAMLRCAMNGELSLSNLMSYGEALLDDKLCRPDVSYERFLFHGLVEW